MGDDPSMLVEANQRAHQIVISHWEEAMVALTELAHARARTAWSALTAAMEAHQAIEEAAFGDWPDLAPPRGASSELVRAEHVRLRLLLHDAAAHLEALAQLATLPEPAQRIALVRALDPFMRARHLFDHHAEREDRLVYPFLEAHLPPGTAAALAAALGER
jgi:hypothetical protein